MKILNFESARTEVNGITDEIMIHLTVSYPLTSFHMIRNDIGDTKISKIMGKELLDFTSIKNFK